MPGREGSRCLTRQEQVASYSRALVMTAATATLLRAAVLLRCVCKTQINCHNCCYKGYEDGLQPETLADGNWLVEQNQPVSKIETKSDTNLRSLYES